MYGTLFFLPQFLQTALHESPFGAGLRLLPWTATLLVFAPLAGAIVDRVGERPLIVTGLVIQACGMAWLAAGAGVGVPYAHLVLPLVLAGAGVSIAMPSSQRMILNAVARPDVGKASGTFTMLRYLGGIFGVAVLVTVFDRSGGLTSPQAFSAGFGPAMWGAAAFSFLAAVSGLVATQPVVQLEGTPNLGRL
jgi:MFS family permease